MKDKNGKDIKNGNRCLIDDKQLGLVTGFQNMQVSVLILGDSGTTCNEQLVDSQRITMK